MWKRHSSKPSQSSKGRAELASAQENRNAIPSECRRNPIAMGNAPFDLEGKKRGVATSTGSSALSRGSGRKGSTESRFAVIMVGTATDLGPSGITLRAIRFASNLSFSSRLSARSFTDLESVTNPYLSGSDSFIAFSLAVFARCATSVGYRSKCGRHLHPLRTKAYGHPPIPIYWC